MSPPSPTSGVTYATGTCIDQRRTYEVVRFVGEGGMGTVYEAHDRGMDRAVALKFLKPDVPAAEQMRFAREVRIGAQLSHSNLVRVFDTGTLAVGTRWMAMEYLEGHDLREVLDSHGRLGVPLLVDVFTQALDALDYIHRRRIAHLDVKPSNVFLTRDAHDERIVVVKLIDFGICRELRPAPANDEFVTGDPRYMAPEQGRLNQAIDHRCDLYALGMTLYEAATGRHPYEDVLDQTPRDLLEAHRQRQPTPPSFFLPGGLSRGFARALDAIFDRACAADPRHRYADAAAMRRDVEALTGHAVARLSIAA